MKKYLLAFATLTLLSTSVFAESAMELCTTEAKDAGIEETAEFNNYVNDCVEQMNSAAQSNQENTEAEGAETAEQGGSDKD